LPAFRIAGGLLLFWNLWDRQPVGLMEHDHMTRAGS
jgi:hypothetical protein